MKQNKIALVVVGALILAAAVGLFFFKNPASVSTSYMGKTVSVDYIGTFPDGSMFDTNIQDVAQKNGLYAAGRSYVPLSFTIGSGQVVPGFEGAIEGMKIGETKKITIQPKDAYGEYDKSKIKSMDKSIFTDAKVELMTGQTYQIPDERGRTSLIKVLSIGDKTVEIDANHPMAGKTLIFDITLKSVK